jgi:hypothetical protein
VQAQQRLDGSEKKSNLISIHYIGEAREEQKRRRRHRHVKQPRGPDGEGHSIKFEEAHDIGADGEIEVSNYG